MAYLENFTDDQRELLASMPFRIGMMVSESDDSGGAHSQDLEMQALESIMVGYSEDFLKSEFVEELMKATLAAKPKWQGWSQSLDTVPQQCRQAVDILGERLENKDILSFKQTMMEVANAVAVAFRESDDDLSATQKMGSYIQYYIESFSARLKGKTPPNLEDFLNISKSERAVLLELAHALNVDLDGNPIQTNARAA